MAKTDMPGRNMQWRMIRDWDSEQTAMAGPYHNGDWPFFLMRRLEYQEDWDSNPAQKYLITLLVVSPDAVPAKEKDSCASSCDIYSWAGPNPTSAQWAEALMDYGTCAQILQEQGNNKRELIRSANREARMLGITFGFRMDGAQNQLGASGWDFVAGNPLGDLAGLGASAQIGAMLEREAARRDEE